MKSNCQCATESLKKVTFSLALKVKKINKLKSKFPTGIESLNKRESNESFFSFTNIPCDKKETQRICLNSKYSIMKNMPLPKVQYDDELAVISPTEPVKNALMIGMDIARMRAREVEKDLDKCVHNNIADGEGVRKEIR